jgi:hypothetical protein
MQRPSTASSTSNRRGPRQLYGSSPSSKGGSSLTTVAPSIPATIRPKSASRQPSSYAQHDNNIQVRRGELVSYRAHERRQSQQHTTLTRPPPSPNGPGTSPCSPPPPSAAPHVLSQWPCCTLNFKYAAVF